MQLLFIISQYERAQLSFWERPTGGEVGVGRTQEKLLLWAISSLWALLLTPLEQREISSTKVSC